MNFLLVLGDFWRFLVVVADRLRGHKHYRCPGCGWMDEEMDTHECVFYGVSHHPIAVDRYGMAL